MLASLLRGATGTRNSTSLESATDEAHTRNLLYGQSQHVYTLAASPPHSPYGSPTFRPGSFDDHGGLEIEEKDVRILVAQDAYGSNELPTLLFDSRNPAELPGQGGQAGQRSTLPSEWRPTGTGASTGKEHSFRNRSSTISGAPSSWTRPVRDTGTREDAFLECMFGVTSSTKQMSSTKMHIIPGRPRPMSSGGQALKSPSATEGPQKRATLARSRTSAYHPTLPSLDSDTSSDTVLITRLFSVSLPDYAQVVNTSNESSAPDSPEATILHGDGSPLSPKSSSKRPKLVERKVPAFAIGLVLYLQPSSHRTSTAQSRPTSRSAPSHAFASASSSYGSDLQSSWTFLDAIPESLASSRALSDEGDRRVDIIVSNWDVILRSLSVLERIASATIYDQLQRVLSQVAGPMPKTPKEKSMQRINQRIIAIADPSIIARAKLLLETTQLSIRRISYALRIPRVVTGLGLTAGHWTDEARMLYRFCGGKQQNFFLFNLLTAFLGNHTEWLERLAPDWYRKQFRATNKKFRETQILASRTVVVSDQKGVARRLIYILASFLPGPPGMDGLHKLGDDGVATPALSTSSPSGFHTRNGSLRRVAGRRAREYHLSGQAEKMALSTSASSADSTAVPIRRDQARKPLMRKDSDGFIVQGNSVIPMFESEPSSQSTNAEPLSTIAPNAATPVAYISTTRDSYFPEGVISDTNDSAASADLSKILQKHEIGHRRTSSSVSSRWGSLVSGISDFWSNKQGSTGDGSSLSTTSPNRNRSDVVSRGADGSPKDVSKSSGLERMVSQLHGDGMTKEYQTKATTDQTQQNSTPASRRPSRNASAVPNLKVDNKDGVIDVELDLPGFVKFSDNLTSPTPTSKSAYKLSTPGRDGSESISSMRSIPCLSHRASSSEQTNVGGYLRRYHEDFALHAVKPYPEMIDEIKRSMYLEKTPEISLEYKPASDGWVSVCTTLVADTKTFSIRRLTLWRKTPIPNASPTLQSVHFSQGMEATKVEEEIVDETVMEFDTTLADAVEKVLNVVSNAQVKTGTPSKTSHSRAASTSTPGTGRLVPKFDTDSQSTKVTEAFEYSKNDHRHVVVGALEDVAKSVNDDLNKQQREDGNHDPSNVNRSAMESESKQENVLREGVKQWMLNVEHARVW